MGWRKGWERRLGRDWSGVICELQYAAQTWGNHRCFTTADSCHPGDSLSDGGIEFVIEFVRSM